MAHAEVADGGTASDTEGSCEYIELAVMNSQQGVVLQLGGWVRCWQLLGIKTGFVTRHECLPRAWTVTLARPRR